MHRLLASIFLLAPGVALPTSIFDYRLSFKVAAPDCSEMLLEALEPSDVGALLRLTEELKQYREVRVNIEAHADPSECMPKDCMGLSLRRASQVSSYLISNGVRPEQLCSVTGRGARQGSFVYLNAVAGPC